MLRDVGSIPGLGRSPGIEDGNPLQSGESHGQGNQAGYRKESDTTEAT